MAAPELVYFAGRGRAEAIRICFAYGGLPLVDTRKGMPEIFAEKARAPYGQFPFMVIEGQSVGQSATLLRYAARKAGLYPEGEVAGLVAESVVEQLNDVINAIAPVVWNHALSADEKAEEFNKLKKDKLPGLFKGIVAILGDKPFLFGAEPTFADIAIFAAVDGMAAYMPTDDLFFTPAPELKRVFDGVAAHAKLAPYFAKRAETEAAERAATEAKAAAEAKAE